MAPISCNTTHVARHATSVTRGRICRDMSRNVTTYRKMLTKMSSSICKSVGVVERAWKEGVTKQNLVAYVERDADPKHVR
jgi:hypothetical protein